MKIIKKILLGILSLIVLVLIIAAIAPKEMTAESEITIDRPKAEVFDYIKYVKNQDHFGKWQKMEPDLKKSYEGTDGTPGFKYSWEGDELGNGSQTITKIVEGERMESELYFGFGEPAQAYFVTKDAGAGKTSVTWGIKGKSMYPLNIMNLFINMDKDFQEGLQNLKTELEQ